MIRSNIVNQTRLAINQKTFMDETAKAAARVAIDQKATSNKTAIIQKATADKIAIDRKATADKLEVDRQAIADREETDRLVSREKASL